MYVFFNGLRNLPSRSKSPQMYFRGFIFKNEYLDPNQAKWGLSSPLKKFIYFS